MSLSFTPIRNCFFFPNVFIGETEPAPGLFFVCPSKSQTVRIAPLDAARRHLKDVWSPKCKMRPLQDFTAKLQHLFEHNALFQIWPDLMRWVEQFFRGCVQDLFDALLIFWGLLASGNMCGKLMNMFRRLQPNPCGNSAGAERCRKPIWSLRSKISRRGCQRNVKISRPQYHI